MIKIKFKILLSIIIAFIILTVGGFVIFKLFSEARQIPILENMGERTDIIVSDRISLGCFIPPELDGISYNEISNNDDLKDNCLKIGDNKYINYNEWNEIKNRMQYGIKLNGYCYNCLGKSCLCLEEDTPGWEGILTEKRSIDFGTNYPSDIGTNLKKKSFKEIRGQPSIIVVDKSKPAHLSIYGGIKTGGKKIVEKVTAALYNREGKISNTAGKERSCYIGNNWNCYHSCENKGNSENDCRVKCDCYTDQRYYDENSLEICKNYCESKEFDGTNSDDCKIGCKEGNNMNCYRDCFIKTQNAKDCETKCNCYYCSGIFENKKFDLVNYLFCEDGLTNDDQKRGCEKFLKIENSTFHTKIGEYTIFKIGDVSLTDPNYRGIAWAVANLTTKEPHPGISCYNYNKYDCYHQCCDEFCEYADIECKGEGNKCKDESKCDERCNCSTTTRTNAEFDDPFILCKTFCNSRDGYYGNGTKITKCQEGCDWAARQYGKPEGLGFKKNVDLTFVIDTSGSMCQPNSDEWSTLCSIIEDITSTVEKKDYKVNVTIYALGENGRAGSCKTNCASTCNEPNCRYKILNCSDIRDDLGITIDCAEGNCYTESWGPGAEWVVKNHPWRKDVLSKILFVISDEGPYCGGACSRSNPRCDDPWDTDEDINYVKKAAQAAIDNNVTIFGLWGIGIEEGLKNLFRDISKPTGGDATKFDTSDPNEVMKIITSSIIREEEFETGYDKFVNLTKKENTLPLENPYIWKNVYEEVWSNLIYIVNWDFSGADWSYPCKGNWEKICTPKFNKSFEMNDLINEIKKLY